MVWLCSRDYTSSSQSITYQMISLFHFHQSLSTLLKYLELVTGDKDTVDVLNALGWYTQISPFPHSYLFIMFLLLMARSYPYLLVKNFPKFKCRNVLLLTCLIQWIVGTTLWRRYSDARLSSLGITLPHNWIKFRFLTIWLSTINRTETLFVFA